MEGAVPLEVGKDFYVLDNYYTVLWRAVLCCAVLYDNSILTRKDVPSNFRAEKTVLLS